MKQTDKLLDLQTGKIWFEPILDNMLTAILKIGSDLDRASFICSSYNDNKPLCLLSFGKKNIIKAHELLLNHLMNSRC